MKLKKFREHYFAKGSAPTVATIKANIEKGSLPGRRVGTEYYVDVQKFELTGNELVDRVLLAS